MKPRKALNALIPVSSFEYDLFNLTSRGALTSFSFLLLASSVEPLTFFNITSGLSLASHIIRSSDNANVEQLGRDFSRATAIPLALSLGIEAGTENHRWFSLFLGSILSLGLNVALFIINHVTTSDKDFNLARIQSLGEERSLVGNLSDKFSISLALNLLFETLVPGASAANLLLRTGITMFTLIGLQIASSMGQTDTDDDKKNFSPTTY